MLTIDLLQRARRIVFVRLSDHEFLSIVALRGSLEVAWWVAGVGYPLRRHRLDHSAESLNLFNGYAWNMELLIAWVRRHCPVCWNVLTGSRRTYDQNKCRQKAYRQRRKIVPQIEIKGTDFILKPETDRHARIALLAYAASVDFENPRLAAYLRDWMGDMQRNHPIRSFEGMPVGDIPDWLIEQTRGQRDDNTSPK